MYRVRIKVLPLRRALYDDSGGIFDNPQRGVEIYDKILSIEAQKGKRSLWPNEFFKHDFRGKAKIVGLPNGDLLVKSKDGKRLWKEFEYDE